MNIKFSLVKITDNEGISIYKDINEYFNGLLYITQYERNEESKEFLHLGIKLLDVKNPQNYTVCIGRGTNNTLSFDEGTSYFYQKISDDVQDEVGISKAGFFIVKVYDSSNKIVYESEPILVKPSIISLKMYEDMVNMLLNINKDFAMQQYSSVYLNGEEKKSDLSENILKLLKYVENPLYNINKNPNVELIKENNKVNYNKIKKITRKVIIEKELYPFKDKFISEVVLESKNTYEHRMIYLSLIDVKSFIDLNYSHCIFCVSKISKEISVTNELIDSTVDIQYKNNLKIKKDKLNYNLNLLNIQENNWKINGSIINKYLNIEIFNQYKKIKPKRERWRATQIFLHDLSYGKLYRRLKNFYEDTNYTLSDLEDEQINIKAVYDIFEIWSFFYMIKILIQEQGWKITNGRNIIKDSNNYMRKNGSLYGFQVELIHRLSKEKIVSVKIVYNKTLHLNDSNLRPDFTFLFNCNNEEKTFYLDAKYHNYLESKQIFYNDLDKVAFEKYYNQLLNTKYSSNGSFILHCIDDDNFRYWGGKRGNSHRVGGFSLTTSNSNNLLTWISLIMEWFYNEYDTCWNCGSINPQCTETTTRGKKTKYHYNCSECGSFWVKSHCYSCNCNKIIKHDLPEKQYHELTNQKWMVKCPKCESSGVEQSRILGQQQKCLKCNGTGYIGCYKHIEGGRCFDCKGSGLR